jgi:hypothetical protein
MPPRLQQRILGQRAGRHQPHHIPPHHRLGPALLRLGRVFQLFGNRHAEPLTDQRQQIALGGMHRHPTHRNRLTQMKPPLRQRDIQRLSRRDRILEEHLVKVAHPVEQQRAGVLRLDLQILRHHRRYAVFGHRSPTSLGNPTKAHRYTKGPARYFANAA